MDIGQVILCCIVMQLFTARQVTCEDTYDIPVVFNPLIQDSVTIDSTAKLFYNMDEDFYSKVTVIDAAINAEQRVQDIIQKTIGVVFLTVASSHVSKTLTANDLLHPTKSKWSYTVDVKSISKASQGELSNIDGKTLIYKIQENAMKVLEARFEFEKKEILDRLDLQLMNYYAVDEPMWIKVVGIIAEKVIANRSGLLNLTTCYLADMLNKTDAQIQGFTLNEVDAHIYDTTMLLKKLPLYREDLLAKLYETFQITATVLSRISNTGLSEMNTMILHDVLELFTNSVLRKLRVLANEITQKDSSFDPEMLLSCTDKWQPFVTIVIPESFDNAAETMAIEVERLLALINISYSEIQQFTITETIDLLEVTIDPLSAQKKLVEATTLSSVLQRHGSDKMDSKKDNVFQVIYTFTNFTESQLTTLYGWTSEDYLFSSMFTLEEASYVCALHVLNYDLLALAKLAVGQIGDIACQSFNALREIWERKTIKFLEDKFSSEQLASDIPISVMISQLTKAPSKINYRVLNVTSEVAKLISNLSINNITMVTTYRSSYLKTLPFQDVIGIALHLKHNGSFDREVVSHFSLTSLTPSLKLTSIYFHTTTKYHTNPYIHKSHKITTILKPTSYVNTHTTLMTSRNTSFSFSSNLLKLTSSFMAQNTTMQISYKTISPQCTTTCNETHQLQSSTVEEYVIAVSLSISKSKVQSSLTPENITSSSPRKYELEKSNILNYSKSIAEQIGSTYQIISTTTSFAHPFSVNRDSSSYMKTQNLSFAKSTASRLTVSSLSAHHFSGNVTDYIFTALSDMTSSSKNVNLSETPASKGYYKTSIPSTKTVSRMTEQIVPSSGNIHSTTAVFTSTILKLSTAIIDPTYSLKHRAESQVLTFTQRLQSSYNPSINASQTTGSVPTSIYKSKRTEMSLVPTVGNQSFNIIYNVTKVLQVSTSLIKPNHKKTPLSNRNVQTETTLPTMTESRVVTSKPNLTKTTSFMRLSITPHNTISYTTSTTVIINTTTSSPVMADIDASSKGDIQSRASDSSPNMISLIIQTTRIESTVLTNVQASTPIVTSLIFTTKNTEMITSSNTPSTKIAMSSILEVSSTMKLLPATTEIFNKEPPTRKPSTNHPTSTTRSVVKPSSNINLLTSSIIGSQSKTSSSYFSTSSLPTPRISSPTTKVSTSSLATRMTSLVKPSTVNSEAISSSIQKPGKI